MKLSFNIAVRFLRSNITQTFIIILGIGIGISVQIFIGSLIQGLQKSLVETTIGSSSQITVIPDTDPLIENYQELESKINDSDPRIEFISPVLDNPALLEYDGNSVSLLVRGFDFAKADNIYKISDAVTDGRLPENENEILLGKSLGDELDLSIGDEINLVTSDKRTIPCAISGFFDLKVSALNNSWCVTSLASAQTFFLADNSVSSIETQVYRSVIFDADIISEKISSSVGGDYKLTDWKTQNESLLGGLQGQSISSLMIQIFVMVSVVLGIASILAITVMQKSRQIGILKAMGIKNSSASLIFLFEGLILGIFGAITGILLGIGLSASFTAFALNPDGTPVVDLYISGSFIAISGIIAVLACVIASLIPARRSSKLSPIDIIRNN